MTAALSTSPLITVLDIALPEEALVSVVGAAAVSAGMGHMATMAGQLALPLDNRQGEDRGRLSPLRQRQVYQGKNNHG